MEPFAILQKTSILGLDFGTSSLKLVHLIKKEGAGLVLVKADLKEHSRPEDAVFREVERLSFLKEFLSEVDVKKAQVAVCINSDRTAMRIVTVPPMPPEELKEAIRIEAKNYFPFPLDETLLDFEVLGETFEEGIKKLRVIVAISPRKTMEEMLSLLKKSGVKPSAVLPVPYALYKLIQLSAGAKEGKTQCVIDVGYSGTECLIIKGKALVFSRKIPVAGEDFTKALTGVLATDQGKTQLSRAEAEKIKREVGIPPEGESKLIGKISTMQMLSMLRAPLEQFAGEMDRSFGYYREENSGEEMHKLILSGRGASLKGLTRFLTQELGVEAEVDHPLRDLKMDASGLSTDEGLHCFAPALGAALHAGAGPLGQAALGRMIMQPRAIGAGINLLPPEIREETKLSVKRAAFQSIVISAVLIFLFIYVGMRLQLTNYKKRIEVAKLELSSLQFDLEKAEEKSLATRIMAGEPYWEDVFIDLSNLVGGPITLSEWRMEGKKMTLRGVIAAREKEGFLAVFIANLERAILNHVKFVTSRETSEKLAEFELECWVD